ncbi:Foldase protein PrsA 2 precursor [Fuerstiella marisgermanici]|uniref:peptidylprolyl isomerase n=2 Tax=Fuerstiella marisgermanici TaxID=1891926 RepID=A0A1P8WHH4_9PLAN|nr:Foldase protein PrsA 2 precursor [Fuerstiella marisgermanici]
MKADRDSEKQNLTQIRKIAYKSAISSKHQAIQPLSNKPLYFLTFTRLTPLFVITNICGATIAAPGAPVMQDAFKKTKTGRGNRFTTLISGTLIAVLAGAIGMQVARVKDGKAAEQVGQQGIGTARVEGAEKPVGRVNGQAITYDELAQECVERHGKEVLENVINRTLIQQACAEGGVSVSAAEVNQEIARISKKFGLPQDQWEKMLQAERGLSPIQYRRDVIWPMLALKKLAGQDIQITREKLEQAWEDTYGPRVKARMMVLDNIRRATEVWERVDKNPDEFEDLARDFSVETHSRALGGTIPPIRRYSGAHPKIREAAFKLKEMNEISGVIQVDVNQYVILKYEGRTEPIEHDPKDVQASLTTQLREQEEQKLVGSAFENLKKKARIDNLLTGETHHPVSQTSGTADAGALVEPAIEIR